METQKTGSGDDIDMGQLLQRIGDRIRAAGIGLLRFLALMRRIPLENRFSFIVTIGTSIALSILYSELLKDNYYESTMILSSKYLNKRLVDNSIENLDNLADEKSSVGLARVLHISDSVAEKILGFQTRPFVSEEEILSLEILKQQFTNAGEDVDEALVEEVVARIEIENRHSFEITIRTLSPTVIPNLQSAIVDYFRDNEYVKRRIEVTRANLGERKLKLEGELRYLDSMKLVIYANYKQMADQTKGGSNNVILSEREVTSPVEISTRDLAIYHDLQDVNTSIYLRDDFEIVDNFTEFSEPASPGTLKLALIGLALGFLVAYLNVAAKSFNTYLANLE